MGARMDATVSTRRAGLRTLARSLWPTVRADRVVAQVVAVGVALRLAIAAAVAIAAQAGIEEPEASVATLVGIVVLVAWMSAGAFAKVALLVALDARLSGRPTTLGRCLARAARSARGIARWVVGQRRGGTFDGWAPPAAFALPALAIEGLGPREAERRSAEIYRARWGDAEVRAPATVAVAVATIVVAFTLAGVAASLHGPAAVAGMVLAMLALVVGLTASTFTRALLAFAVYRVEIHGEGSFGFEPGQLDAFVDLKQRSSRR